MGRRVYASARTRGGLCSLHESCTRRDRHPGGGGGLFWKQLSRLPLFRLPGDIVIDRPGLKFFFPITTMIVVSLVVSLLLWLFRR
jgi:hypothetical protein